MAAAKFEERLGQPLRQIRQLLALSQLERLKAERRGDARSLIPFGWKCYSQNEEDGMIREIFRRIGTTNKVFVEFGVGDGLENNTLALLFEGWRGLWIEGSEETVRTVSRELPSTLASGRLRVVHSFVTRENIDATIAAALPRGEIDLLSVDIDGNDIHVFEGISSVRPRVVVMEYNAKFVPPAVFLPRYDPAFLWNGNDDNSGASLEGLARRMAARDYLLVGCDLTGTNAFFVRADLEGGKFKAPHTAEAHHEPPRYLLAIPPSGHAPSFQTLERASWPET